MGPNGLDVLQQLQSVIIILRVRVKLGQRGRQPVRSTLPFGESLRAPRSRSTKQRASWNKRLDAGEEGERKEMERRGTLGSPSPWSATNLPAL